MFIKIYALSVKMRKSTRLLPFITDRSAHLLAASVVPSTGMILASLNRDLCTGRRQPFASFERPIWEAPGDVPLQGLFWVAPQRTTLCRMSTGPGDVGCVTDEQQLISGYHETLPSESQDDNLTSACYRNVFSC
jgi:hypothetical protein